MWRVNFCEEIFFLGFTQEKKMIYYKSTDDRHGNKEVSTFHQKIGDGDHIIDVDCDIPSLYFLSRVKKKLCDPIIW